MGRSSMGDQKYVCFWKQGVVCSPPNGVHIDDLSLVCKHHTVTRNGCDLQIAARGLDDVFFEFRLLHRRLGRPCTATATAPGARRHLLIGANIRPCHSRRERWRRVLCGACLPMGQGVFFVEGSVTATFGYEPIDIPKL